MNIRLLLSLFAVTVGAVFLHAADEPDDEYSPDLGIYATAKDSMRFGFRAVNGAKVKFGNLGTVAFTNPFLPASAGDVTRRYDNGIVNKDALRGSGTSLGGVEVDANGNSISTPGGRYNTSVTTTPTDGTPPVTTITGNFLAFTPGQTRSWRYDRASQISPNGSGIIMSSFGATSEGASLEGKKQLSSGIELQSTHILGKLAGKWEVSVVGGLALSNISSSQAGLVHSRLHTLSDTFSLLGQPAPAINPQGQPTFTDFDLGGGTVNPSGLETTTPLATVPDAASHTDKLGGPGSANVDGVWKMKGAYFVMKIGPEIRAALTKGFALSAGIGLAGAYVGTNYTALERLTVPGDADGVAAITVGQPESSEANKFLPGYYANLDAQWQANERTGFFAGVTYEGFGAYNQSVGGRTAKVDLGSTAGIHGGISIKF